MNIYDIKKKLRGTDYISDKDLDNYIEFLLEDHDKLEELMLDMQLEIEYYQSFGLKGEM